jgi:hypothetical protein
MWMDMKKQPGRPVLHATLSVMIDQVAGSADLEAA